MPDDERHLRLSGLRHGEAHALAVNGVNFSQEVKALGEREAIEKLAAEYSKRSKKKLQRRPEQPTPAVCRTILG